MESPCVGCVEEMEAAQRTRAEILEAHQQRLLEQDLEMRGAIVSDEGQPPALPVETTTPEPVNEETTTEEPAKTEEETAAPAAKKTTKKAASSEE